MFYPIFQSQSSSHSHNKEPVFKSLIVLAGIYILFVIEGIMKLSHHKNDRKSKVSDLYYPLGQSSYERQTVP